MKEFSVSADLDIAAHVLFLERDSVAFRCLLAEALDLGTIEFEKEVSEVGVVKVWQKTYPRIDKYVPAGVVKFVQKYVGTLVYTDILSYDPQKLQRPPYEIEVTSIPPVFKDKTTLKSKLIIESLGTARCRQTLQGSVDVQLSGIGRTAEKIIVQQLAKVYESIPAVVNRWAQLRAAVVERAGSEWLLLGRPEIQVDWILQEYRNYQQGRLPDSVPDTGSKEDLGNLGVSEEQFIQKAQAQLQHEEAGLKKLPTDQQTGSVPGAASHTAGPVQHTGYTASPTAAASTAGPTAASTATEQSLCDNSAASQGGTVGTEDGRSAMTLDRESSFATPDRASSMEVAAAEEPVPWSREQQSECAQHTGLDRVSEHQPSGIASSDMTGEAISCPQSPVNGPAAADNRISGDAARGLPSRQQRPNRFLQCITCGAGRGR
ncbi:hypothetical protein ABBQ32_001346 [Trebouxia sp. C0010 RCD-2024]